MLTADPSRLKVLRSQHIENNLWRRARVVDERQLVNVSGRIDRWMKYADGSKECTQKHQSWDMNRRSVACGCGEDHVPTFDVRGKLEPERVQIVRVASRPP